MTKDKDLVTKTNDGYVVELFANIKSENEIQDIIEGISILEPKMNLVEEEQQEKYKEVVEKMDYRPVIIKAPEMEEERLVIKTQLRAILRAAKHGEVSIVLPKISSVTELKEYKEIIEECQNELESENTPYKKHIKLGVIVEIPSVALNSYELAKECDFFFIETNSLTKYTFGAKEKKHDLYTKFQPSVIKLVQQAIEGAHDAGIFCGICGEVVENELYIPLLIGLGIDEFSINSKNITKTRTIISELDKSDCKDLAEEVFQLRTLEDIDNKLKQFMQS